VFTYDGLDWLTTAERQFYNSWTEHNRSLSQTWPSTCYFLSLSLSLSEITGRLAILSRIKVTFLANTILQSLSQYVRSQTLVRITMQTIRPNNISKILERLFISGFQSHVCSSNNFGRACSVCSSVPSFYWCFNPFTKLRKPIIWTTSNGYLGVSEYECSIWRYWPRYASNL